MNTNQVTDNLIRAYCGLPLLHVDYTRSTGTIDDSGNASIGGSLTVRDQLVPVAMLSRVITDVLNYSAGASRKQQLTVTAEPVLDNNAVYDAYLDFLNEDARGPKLIQSLEPPPCDAAHLVRFCEPYYYWIPIYFKKDFLQLALTTTVQRGRALSVPSYFEAEVSSVTPELEDPGLAVITFGGKVYNDNGRMTATIDGTKYQFPVSPYSGPENDKSPGDRVTQLILDYQDSTPERLSAHGEPNPFTIEELQVKLQDETVRVRLDHFVPTVPTTTELINGIRSDVELLRLQER